MQKLLLLFFTAVFFSAPAYSFAQNNLFPRAATGPDAALDFYEGFTGAPAHVFDERGRKVRVYPQGKQIPLEGLTNITQLHEHFYHPKQILEDFEKTREPGEFCALVMVKTEACREGPRMCAVATAALEKESTPILSQFKIYGIKVPPNRFDKKTKKEVITGTNWEKHIKKLYEFKQGPGARLVALCNGMMIEVGGAGDLGLSDDEFRRDKGTTPHLEESLEYALTQLLPHAPPSQPAPRISVSDEPRNAAEADAWIKKREEKKEKKDGQGNKLAFGSSGAQTPRAPLGAVTVTEEDFKKASVKLVIKKGGGVTNNGSATIIGCSPVLNNDGKRNCLLVTAGHAYAKDITGRTREPGLTSYELVPRNGYIELPGGITKSVSFIGGDLEKDLALAGFTINADEMVNAVPLAPRGFRVTANDKVIQAGYPHGGRQFIQYRTVKAIDFFKHSQNIVCHNTTSPGDSGGGLLALQHGLVGICSASDPDENQTIFVDAQEIYNFVDHNVPAQLKLKRDPALYNLIFSQ